MDNNDHFLMYREPGSDLREPTIEGPFPLQRARERAETKACGGATVTVLRKVDECMPSPRWSGTPRPVDGSSVVPMGGRAP